MATTFDFLTKNVPGNTPREKLAWLFVNGKATYDTGLLGGSRKAKERQAQIFLRNAVPAIEKEIGRKLTDLEKLDAYEMGQKAWLKTQRKKAVIAAAVVVTAAVGGAVIGGAAAAAGGAGGAAAGGATGAAAAGGGAALLKTGTAILATGMSVAKSFKKPADALATTETTAPPVETSGGSMIPVLLGLGAFLLLRK
jgi:hypothetical protein